MNEKLILVLSLTLVVSVSFAQEKDKEEEVKKTFKKENLFTGGSVDASFGSGRTALGLSPYFGYSVTKWCDAAASLNFSYISQRDVLQGNDKVRQTTLGPGAFVRLFPVKFLFAQVQYEHNFIKQKYIPAPGGYYASSKTKVDANSLLIGAGYTSGRSSNDKDVYYYFSVMVDVLSSPYSPYRDNYSRVVPVVRAGLNIPLFQGKKK